MSDDIYDVLFRLWMLSWGGTIQYNGKGGGGVPQSKPPAGVRLQGGSEETPYEHWLRRWEGAVSVRAKETVLEGAKAELRRWHHKTEATVVGETEADLEARVVREGEGWGLAEIALHCRCTEKFARKARLKGERSLENGKPLVLPDKAKKLPPADRAVRVRAMREEGMSLRQIGDALNVDAMTVRRDLANV